MRISHRIMPLVINSLGGGHTHAHTHTHTHTDVRTKTILRNQVHASHTLSLVKQVQVGGKTAQELKNLIKNSHKAYELTK